MLRKWRIRKKGSTTDPYHDYGAFSTVFCLKINHGGAFTTPLKIRYKGEKSLERNFDFRRISYNHISHLLSNSQKEMDHQYPTVAKIPVLDTGKFEQWQFRIQQYLQHEHYALWEVIEFGDSYKVPINTDPVDTTTKRDAEQSGRTITFTTEDMQKKKNDVKARTTLLLSLPDEHQLRFIMYKTAKELWAAILKTFGGNEATKKRKKNRLKQQYGNFKAEGTETLEQTFSRLQVIISQLQFMDVKVEKDDHNQKFLTILAPEWLMHTIDMAFISSLKNSSNEDDNTICVTTASTAFPTGSVNVVTISQDIASAYIASQSYGCQIKFEDINQIDEDDMEEMDITTASTAFPTGSVNVVTISQDIASAYIASQSYGCQIKFEDINQIDEDDMEEMDIKWNMALLSMRADKFWKRTRKKISIQGSDVAGFDKSKVECFNCHKMGHFARECRANVATISQDTASAFIASQSNGSQIKFEDINQIDEDDMEEMDIKWNMALLSMRADKFWKRTGKKISIQGSDVAGFDKSKVECFNCHKMGHFARECRAPRSQERGRKESYRQGSKAEEKSSKALMAIDGIGWDWSYTTNEENHALVADGETPTEFALMANIENKVFDNSLCSKDCKKNTDSLNSKITELKSKLSDSNNYWYSYKLGVAQLEERLNEYKDREEKYIVKIRTLELYRESNLERYNVVPPPAADLYLSPKKDLSWTGPPEFVDNTVTDYSRTSPTISTSTEDQNKDTSTSEDVASPNLPKPFVKFVKPKDSQPESKSKEQETPKKSQV
nr:hypothetical protein [Tanacetum cinerariifolium]